LPTRRLSPPDDIEASRLAPPGVNTPCPHTTHKLSLKTYACYRSVHTSLRAPSLANTSFLHTVNDRRPKLRTQQPIPQPHVSGRLPGCSVLIFAIPGTDTRYPSRATQSRATSQPGRTWWR